MTSIPDDLHDLLLLIKQEQTGISEYELLKRLFMRRDESERPNLSDTLVLFQQHFLLFHQLYRLRDILHLQQSGSLHINVLNIRWLSGGSSVIGDETALRLSDPLRDYYLNLENLEGTDQQGVDQLLERFWRGIGNVVVDVDTKVQALLILDLPPDSSFLSVRRRYRELIAQHHPDRGGSHERTQEINGAMKTLKDCFPRSEQFDN